jgi:hypothetical protein
MKYREEELRVQPQNNSHQIMTPESRYGLATDREFKIDPLCSPHVPRTVTPTHTVRTGYVISYPASKITHHGYVRLTPENPKPRYFPVVHLWLGKLTPGSLTLESPATLAPSHRISSPPSASSSENPSSSRLSSPFMAKLSLSERSFTQSRTPTRTRPSSPSDNQPVHVDDVFSIVPAPTPSVGMTMSTPPVSPLVPPPSSASGEIEKMRLATLEEKMAAFREAESRRPDYLKRGKRARTPDGEVQDGRVRGMGVMHGVGIMETPNKGRRLKLFQETSEESFEESLMAGGYGRYVSSDI